MKLAIFADIHSNYPNFKKGIEDAKNRNIDEYIFLGDYVTDGFDGNKVIELVKKTKGYAICGNREIAMIEYEKGTTINYDKYYNLRNVKFSYDSLNKESLDYIKTLDMYKIIELENKKICISHSTPYSVTGDLFYNSYEVFDKLIQDFNCDIYLFGHEHKNYHTIYKGKHFINPGAIGTPAHEVPITYGILEIDENNIKYEKIELQYDYEEIEKYYKQSDYYKYAMYWCNLILENFKDGKNHTEKVVLLAKEKMEKISKEYNVAIPNDIFIESYEKYMNELEKKRGNK